MPQLEFETEVRPEQTKLEVTCLDELAAGGRIALAVGDNELDEVCPRGKAWAVVANIRVIETDA